MLTEIVARRQARVRTAQITHRDVLVFGSHVLGSDLLAHGLVEELHFLGIKTMGALDGRDVGEAGTAAAPLRDRRQTGRHRGQFRRGTRLFVLGTSSCGRNAFDFAGAAHAFAVRAALRRRHQCVLLPALPRSRYTRHGAGPRDAGRQGLRRGVRPAHEWAGRVGHFGGVTSCSSPRLPPSPNRGAHRRSRACARENQVVARARTRPRSGHGSRSR